jgi:capsular polysaccharide biosynthesis protein
MDAGLFFAVLWRSKRLMLGGLLLGVVLAALAYGQPGFANGRPALTPRGNEVWQSEAQLLITQPGFPYGRSGYNNLTTLAGLSPIYANLANGNAVLPAVARRMGIAGGSVQATDSLEPAAGVNLPFVNLVATAPTQNQAMELVNGASLALQRYVATLQSTAGIPAKQRIQLAIVKAGTTAKLAKGPKLSIPILVFMAVLIAITSLVFLKENLMPRVAAELGRVPSEALSLEPDTKVQSVSEHMGASNGGGLSVAREPVAAHRDLQR